MQARSTAGSCRGLTFVELLVTVLLLSMIGAAGLATWQISVRVPATHRHREIATLVGIRELERLRGAQYPFLTDGGYTRYYDRDGNPVDTPVEGGYRVRARTTVILDRDRRANAEDLRELRVEVWNNAHTLRYETFQTLLSFGGV
ncbi:MAG: hypothetical protein RMJ43_03115 [Chloroherpetonaceae bacterium]|nr:hypothetical protein [Chthonomonadaceae bacterium]MDW8206800.1 hypothetical protein [Chloroherpetonaceae bacterium]